MSQALRRYEILLPLRFNDRTPVPRDLLMKTRSELRKRFGAISSESQVIRGDEEGTNSQDDELVRMFVDVPDTAENREFFEAAKERLARRFEQTEIWISSFPVERL